MILGLSGKKTDTKKGLPNLEGVSALERMEWATQTYSGKILLTTSFGAQSAAFLHLATQTIKDLPLLFIDTGYHFPETLEFAQELTKKLNLNSNVLQTQT